MKCNTVQFKSVILRVLTDYCEVTDAEKQSNCEVNTGIIWNQILIANNTKGEIEKGPWITQQKKLKHETAMNKLYTDNLWENNTTTKFITNIVHYITKKLQINLILKVSSLQRETLWQEKQILWKVLKVGCVHGLSKAAFTSCLRNPGYVKRCSFFIISASSFYAQNLSCGSVTL